MKSKKEPPYIVFEGVNGCGKTTLAAALVAEMRDRGLPVAHLAMPGPISRAGQLILDVFNECPNVAHSFRAQVRDMLNGMEQKFAGTKYSIVNSFLETLPILKEKFKGEMAQACSKCGEPSANETCSACNYLERLKKSVMHQN